MTDAPVQITFSALYQRINRRLAKEDCLLRKAKGRYDKVNNGEWYVLNWRTKTVPRRHVAVTDFARELGVLHDWETVVEERQDGQ